MRVLFVCMISIFIGACVFAEQAENSIEVEMGKDLVITLPSDPTSGCAWQLAEPVDDEMLQFVGSKYVSPEYPNISGSKGAEAWTFKTLTTGTTVVSFKYMKATGKGTKPEKEEKFPVASLGEFRQASAKAEFNITIKPSDEERLKETQSEFDRLHSKSFSEHMGQ